MRGTRWLSASELELDAGGVVNDRCWSAVGADLDAVRAAKHPEMMRLVVGAGDLPEPGPDDGEVTYWGRTLPASVVAREDASALVDQLSELVAAPVRLAHTWRRPGFVWGAPVSVLFASELADADLPGLTGGRLDEQVDRYRANVVIDDLLAPVRVRPGDLLMVGPVELQVVEPIDRCTVIDHDPLSGVRDERLMRRLRPGAVLAWGCRVLDAGVLRCGDHLLR